MKYVIKHGDKGEVFAERFDRIINIKPKKILERKDIIWDWQCKPNFFKLKGVVSNEPYNY